MPHDHHHCEPALSEAGFEELQAFLTDHLEQARCMPLDVAHGFLTGVLVGPNELEPANWLPPLLGNPDFDDDEHGEHIIGLTLALHQDVRQDLEHHHYGPMVIYKPMEDGEPLPLPYGWCEGFMLGLKLHGETEQERIHQDIGASQHLALIGSFLLYEQDQLLNPPDEAVHREIAASLPRAVTALYDWFRQPKIVIQ